MEIDFDKWFLVSRVYRLSRVRDDRLEHVFSYRPYGALGPLGSKIQPTLKNEEHKNEGHKNEEQRVHLLPRTARPRVGS
eukprot:6056963-Prymnesium_polylepis.1